MHVWRPTKPNPLTDLIKASKDWFQEQIAEAVTDFTTSGSIDIRARYEDGLPVIFFAAGEPIEDVAVLARPLEEALLETLGTHLVPNSKLLHEDDRAEIMAVRDVLARVLGEYDRRLAAPFP